MDMREQIMGAALRVYAEHGYRGATTRRIAQEAGVNEVTLFRHFGSKSQLIHEAIESAVPVPEMPALPDRPMNPGEELRAWARVHLAHLFAMRSFIRTAIGECEEHAEIGTSAGDRTRRVGVELRAYLGRVKAAGLCDADCDVEAAAIMLMGVLFVDAMSRDIMPDMFPHPPERSVAEYVDLFLRAIGGKGGRRARVDSGAKG